MNRPFVRRTDTELLLHDIRVPVARCRDGWPTAEIASQIRRLHRARRRLHVNYPRGWHAR